MLKNINNTSCPYTVILKLLVAWFKWYVAAAQELRYV